MIKNGTDGIPPPLPTASIQVIFLFSSSPSLDPSSSWSVALNKVFLNASDRLRKVGNARFTTPLLNLNLRKNVENIVVSQNVFNSVTFAEKPQMKINSLTKQKH